MDKDIEKTEKQIAELKKENHSLTVTQQELKAKIKELTELPPKVISGHQVGKVQYIRESRVK